nr:G protein-coupled receptor [Proales similis]
MASSEAISLRELSKNLNFYCSVVGYPIGILLNALSIVIFVRPNLNKTNMGFLYTWQAAFDIMLLGAASFSIAMGTAIGIPLDATSDFLCRFLSIVRRILVHASSWMSLFITFDRFLFVRYPNRLLRIRKSKRLLTCAILVMVALISLIDIPNALFYLEVTEISRNNQTIVQTRCTSSPIVKSVSDMISILMRTFIPFAFMMLLDALIIVFLKQSKGRSQRGQSSKRERQFTLVVLASNGVFLFFNFPVSVMYIVTTIHSLGEIRLEPLPAAVVGLTSLCTLLFSFIVQCFSFVTNLAFNKLFRHEIYQMLGIGQGQTVKSASNSSLKPTASTPASAPLAN